MVTTAYEVLVDWDDNGDYVGVYDDISADTFQFQFRRGRDYASQVSGNSTAGKLTLRLNNEDGKYSPSNASSVLAGNLEVGRPIRVGRGASNTYPYTFPFQFGEEFVSIWTGKVESIKPEPSGTGLNMAVLTAVGPLGYINDQVPVSEQQTDIRTDEAITFILDEVGWSATQRDLAVGQTTMRRWWTDSSNTITALRIVEETENGFIKEKANGDIAFESRNTRLYPPYITSQATFSDASNATHTYLQLEQKDPIETVINTFEALYRSYLVTGQPDLWVYPETGTDSPQLAAGETRTFIAEYPNNSSPPEAVAVSSWMLPLQSGVDVIANNAADGSGDDASSGLLIQTNAGQTNRLRIIVTNNWVNPNTGRPQTVWLQTLKARGTPVHLKDTTLVSQSAPASVTKYGERKFTADTPFFPYLATAQSWCNYQIQMYSTPINIMTMTFNANVSQNNMDAALQLDVSDRITLDATGNARLGVLEDFFIEEVNHSVTDGGQVHMVTWKLSPADSGYTQFWKLDTGELDSTTVPAY